MRIIKMNVEDYLRRIGCTEEEIDRFVPRCVNEYVLRDVLDTMYKEYLWDYDLMDVNELIEREVKMNIIEDWREKEDTYVYLFNRLWEVEE